MAEPLKDILDFESRIAQCAAPGSLVEARSGASPHRGAAAAGGLEGALLAAFEPELERVLGAAAEAALGAAAPARWE